MSRTSVTRARPAPPGRGRSGPKPLAWLALLLLLLFGGVLLWRAALAGVDAVRGRAYTRPVVASRTEAPTPHPDPVLQAAIQRAAALPDGHASVLVENLDTGATASLDADQSQPAASLFKLPILVETLKQVRLRQLSLDQPLEITQDDWTDGSGVLQARVGDSLPVSQLLQLMIGKSDNIAALVLLDAVGIDNVNQDMRALGLTSTVLHDHRAGDPADHTTSAADMAKLLQLMADGQMVDADTSESALKLLEQPQDVNLLAEGANSPWVRVAHKWGELPGVLNEAGLIYTPGGTYTVVVLTQGGTAADAQTAIRQTAHATLDTLQPHTP